MNLDQLVPISFLSPLVLKEKLLGSVARAFLWAGYLTCHSTNSVRALQDTVKDEKKETKNFGLTQEAQVHR